MSSFVLTRGQEIGLKLIENWYRSQNEQIFKLAGYAGTGKSFMSRQTIKNLNLKRTEVAFCAYTGKASLVLMRYLDNEYDSSTIHSLIYEVIDLPSGEVAFELKKKLVGIKLIVVDEASMVSKEILDDLKSFGISILAIGDHGQLPAIGEQADLMKEPDHILDEIMRQLEGDPLIHLGMLARQQKKIDLGKYGTSAFVMSKKDMKIEDMIRADQVICGYNKTLHRITEQMRDFHGMKGLDPEFGDKVIFNRNNNKRFIEGYPIVNGMIGTIVNEPTIVKHPEAVCRGMKVWKLEIQPDFLSSIIKDVYVPVNDFYWDKSSVEREAYPFIERMQYAQALTCHKSQGDQFDNIYVIDESFGDEPWRWLYTAITRARRGMILAIKEPVKYY